MSGEITQVQANVIYENVEITLFYPKSFRWNIIRKICVL